jgi:hypothetical protein
MLLEAIWQRITKDQKTSLYHSVHLVYMVIFSVMLAEKLLIFGSIELKFLMSKTSVLCHQFIAVESAYLLLSDFSGSVYLAVA